MTKRSDDTFSFPPIEEGGCDDVYGEDCEDDQLIRDFPTPIEKPYQPGLRRDIYGEVQRSELHKDHQGLDV